MVLQESVRAKLPTLWNSWTRQRFNFWKELCSTWNIVLAVLYVYTQASVTDKSNR